jgi:hypothetical protein
LVLDEVKISVIPNGKDARLAGSNEGTTGGFLDRFDIDLVILLARADEQGVFVNRDARAS